MAEESPLASGLCGHIRGLPYNGTSQEWQGFVSGPWLLALMETLGVCLIMVTPSHQRGVGMSPLLGWLGGQFLGKLPGNSHSWPPERSGHGTTAGLAG